MNDVFADFAAQMGSINDSIAEQEKYLCAAKLRMEEDMPHYKLPGQGIAVQHDGIDGGQDGLLERFLVQGGRLGAELLPVVQAADTPPYGALDSALGPHAPPVGRPALPAEQQVAEDMLTAVLPPAGGGALSRGTRLGVPPGHLQLDGVEDLPADDALMVVLNQVFGELSGVGDHLLADAVLDEGLLEQDVPAVFLVGQDAPDMGAHPLYFSGDRGNSLALQGHFDLPDAVPGQVAVIDEADGLRLLWDDSGFSIRPLLVAQQILVVYGDMAGSHSLLLAPAHPAAGALALGLGEGSVQGDQELALRVDGVDVLFLEDDWDTQAPQLPGEVETS